MLIVSRCLSCRVRCAPSVTRARAHWIAFRSAVDFFFSLGSGASGLRAAAQSIWCVLFVCFDGISLRDWTRRREKTRITRITRKMLGISIKSTNITSISLCAQDMTSKKNIKKKTKTEGSINKKPEERWVGKFEKSAGNERWPHRFKQYNTRKPCALFQWTGALWMRNTLSKKKKNSPWLNLAVRAGRTLKLHCELCIRRALWRREQFLLFTLFYTFFLVARCLWQAVTGKSTGSSSHLRRASQQGRRLFVVRHFSLRFSFSTNARHVFTLARESFNSGHDRTQVTVE